MSGQPSKTFADQNKFRNEYMDTLNLQEQINDMNLQANKTYLLTGQLPPQSQMQDTRTSAEKLKDVETLKQSIAKDLAPIAEPQFAYAIVEAVMNSPLNIEGSLLRFLAQRASNIAENLSKVYSFGIAGDANDLQIIVEFIKNMYSDQQGKFQTAKTYIQSMSSTGTRGNVLSANDIDSVKLDFQEFVKQMKILESNLPVRINPNVTNKIDNINMMLDMFKRILPTTNQISLMLSEMSNPVQGLNQPFSQIDMKNFFETLENLPKANQLKIIIDKCIKMAKSQNWNVLLKTLDDIVAMLNPINNIAKLRPMINIVERQKQREDISDSLQAEQTREIIRQQTEEQKNASKAQKVYIVNPEDDAVWTRMIGGVPAQPAGNAMPVAPPANVPIQAPRPVAPVAPPAPVAQPVQRQPVLRQLPAELAGLVNSPLFQRRLAQQANEEAFQARGSLNFRSEIENENLIRQVESIIDTLDADGLAELAGILQRRGLNVRPVAGSIKGVMRNEIRKQVGGYNLGDYGMVQGLGIKKRRVGSHMAADTSTSASTPRRRVGRPRGSGLVKPPVVKVPNFVGFGVNEINQKQLDKGILKIRRNTKSNYMDMPSKRISSNLQGIIKTIIGGGVPKYEELGKLDDDEKDYLHKIISRSELQDRLSVPAPSKDQQEKDIHNFEVMKGQIMAGNDSKEMVKKFKLLVRKLSKQGLLPKNDVEEILDVLTDIGY